MKILVLNCGSSSIKYQLFNMESKEVLAKGSIEKIGLHGSFLRNTRNDGDRVKLVGEVIDHQAGIEYILGVLISEKHGSLSDLIEIDAVGHRVVHGAETFKSSVVINEEVIKKIEECIDLAPLHNPPNLKGIYAIKNLLPQVPQVAVFDTAFHQTMPDYAYMYAIPYSLYKKYGLRRYGFHGSSHRFVSSQACNFLNLDYEQQKIITCHLGNGASLTAIKEGKSIDTSMGLTPVEGLMMGTRSGDLDLGILTYIVNKEEISINAANTLINKHSGLLGVSGVSSDMREVMEAAETGNDRALLALNIYAYRVKKYIGSYIATLGGLDVLVFTGGVGENAANIRSLACTGLDYLGIVLDEEKNNAVRGEEAIISTQDSKVKIVVIPTNEEFIIAQDTRQ
ncbi:MAG: acetate/propionate family kinase, partial [Cyclobacteriaceae bacterium]